MISSGGRKKRGSSDDDEEAPAKDSDEEFEEMLKEAETAMGDDEVQVNKAIDLKTC